MSRIWMSHGTNMDETCLKYEWVMSQIWLDRRITHMNESRHTLAKVMPRLGIRHVTHLRSHVTNNKRIMSHTMNEHLQTRTGRARLHAVTDIGGRSHLDGWWQRREAFTTTVGGDSTGRQSRDGFSYFSYLFSSSLWGGGSLYRPNPPSSWIW